MAEIIAVTNQKGGVGKTKQQLPETQRMNTHVLDIKH